MKQVSKKTIRRLALSDSYGLAVMEQYEAADWMRENALVVAEIELGKGHKTRFGEWPKGWRAEMKRCARRRAEDHMVSAFMRREVFELDGAMWLRRLDTIERLSRANTTTSHGGAVG